MVFVWFGRCYIWLDSKWIYQGVLDLMILTSIQYYN
jgi:hypothetical protein